MSNVVNYTDQGGAKTVIGGEIDVTGTLKIGSVAVTATAAELNILDGVTATAAELNLLDLSAQTEEILVAGAVSVVKRHSELSAASGAYAVTLAAPDATMLGQVKVIEMTTAGNAITMALTNVQGGTAGSSASFDAENETLVLVAGTNKWNVVAEIGVTLS